jgi:hypothetical protein
VAEAIKYIEDKVTVVDPVATDLQAVIENSQSVKIPVGDLQGKWTLQFNHMSKDLLAD